MVEQKQWASAWARFEAFREGLPTYITEERVAQYHEILRDLQVASGEFLNEFRISEEKVKPKALGGRRRGYGGGPGHTYYSKEKYCDLDYLTGQVEALWRYMKRFADQQPSTSPRTTAERPSRPASIHVEHMYGSNIQHSSPGAAATAGYQAHFQPNDPQILELIKQIKKLQETIDLSPQRTNELRADVSTLEAQIASPNPKAAIIMESLRSVKSILESAAGSILAPYLVHEIAKYVG